VVNAAQTTVNFVSQHIDTVQTVLNFAGMIPGLGAAFDAVNGLVYAARGDLVNAAMSFSSAIPVVGDVIGGARAVAKVAGKFTDIAKIVDNAENITQETNIIKKVHGNTANDMPAILYRKLDKDGNFLKWGVTQDTKKRYTIQELNGGWLESIEIGPRREMLKKERKLVETLPGPENHEQWAGIYSLYWSFR
jgi:hypothetical protein